MNLDQITNRVVEKLNDDALIHKILSDLFVAGWQSHLLPKGSDTSATEPLKHAKTMLGQALTSSIKEVAEEIMDSLDVEIEAWMAVHQEKQKSFKTDQLLEHLRNSVLSTQPNS